MKYLVTLLFCGFSLSILAQQRQFDVHKLSLPKELEFYDNQFSGLAIAQDKLLLLSESRLQDKAEAKLYTVALADLDRQLADTTYVLPYQKLPLTNLAALRGKMKALGQSYEGLEAMVLAKDAVYFSVETATPSNNCYVLKGHLGASAVVLDTTYLMTLPKPVAADGSHIYNAGFEALANVNEHLFGFFEYNSFPRQNYAYEFLGSVGRAKTQLRAVPFSPLPFRITDMTATKDGHFTAINYFFKGEGEDAVYRTPATDVATKLIADKGVFKNYCRLIDVEFKGNAFRWKPLWEFPVSYGSYNWEGIAAYKGGYLIINDKYTPARPYKTTLLYLQGHK